MALEHVIWDVKRVEYHRLREQREDIIRMAKKDRNPIWREKIGPVEMDFGYFDFGNCILLGTYEKISGKEKFTAYTDSKFSTDAKEVLATNIRNQIEARIKIMRGFDEGEIIH